MKIKRFYQTRFSVKNLPNEDDYEDVKNFKKRDPRYAYLFAEEEFQRVKNLISNGTLVRHLEKAAAEIVKLEIRLYWIQQRDEGEKEVLLKSHDDDNLQVESWKKLWELDTYLIEREADHGYVRHSLSIQDNFFFRFQKKVIIHGVEKQLEFEESGISGYDSFNEAMESNLIYWPSWKELDMFYPEHGEQLIIRSSLIKKVGEDETEFLLEENDQFYPLTEAFKTELSNKFYLEEKAKRKAGKVKYGIRPILWDEAIEDLKKEPQDWKWEDSEKVINSTTINSSIPYYYLVFRGYDVLNPEQKRTLLHLDLLKARLAAFDFYEDVLDSLTSLNNTMESVSLVLIRIYDKPLFLRTTNMDWQELLEFGQEEESRLLASLGYDLTD